jgi:hypothetical protein
MSTLSVLARTKATAVWLVLIGATLAASVLGSDHATTGHRGVSTLILGVAFVKVRLVGIYFMELRRAPAALRLVFEGYCVVVFAAILGMYLAS